MREHITPSDITAFHAQTLDRQRIEEIGAHLRECADCASLVWRDRGIQQSVQSVAQSDAKSRTRRYAWLATAAAAAGGAMLTIVLWPTRATPPPPGKKTPTPPPIIATTNVIRDGAVSITLDAKGTPLRVSSPNPEWDALLGAALQTATLPAANLHGLTSSGQILRGTADGGPKIALEEPVGIVVESATPLFRWTIASGARYRVTVARDGNRVARSEWLRDSEWRPRDPLPRGATYDWQLTIVFEDNEWTLPAVDASPARFRVLSESEARELHSARASGSRLLAGLVAARLGITDVAAHQLRAFADEHRDLAAASKLAAAAQTHDRPAPTTTNADQ